MNKEAKVGLFVFIGLVVLFLLSTQVGSFKNLSKSGYEVETYLVDASGLEKNAKVKANGLEIGYIKDMKISNDKILAKLFLYDGVKIPIDSKLRSEQGSLLGGKYLNITLGKSKKFLKSGSLIKSQPKLASFDEASDSIKKAADEFKAFIAEFREILDDEAKNSLRNTLVNLETTLNNFNDMAVSIKSTSDKFAKTADIINNRLPAIARNLDILIRDLKNKAPHLMAKFEDIEDQINAILAENREGLKNTITGAENFFDGGKDAFEKIDKLLATVDKVKLQMGMRSEYQASDGYQKGYVDLDYIPTDSKRYKFSIVSMDDYSRLGPHGSVIEPKKHEDSKTLFSAQIVKRYGDVALRTGLIESSVGAGADYYMFNDRLKLSSEVFDFNARNDVRGDRAHAKLSGRFTILKHVDFYGGYDNFLNKNARNGFVGIGFHFYDEDLKRLIMSQSVGSMAK